MKKIAVVCAPGIGDALILHIASHQLALAGYDVTTVCRHRFGRWLSGSHFGELGECDEIFLQHDNSPLSKAIHQLDKPVYTFFGSHSLVKHGILRAGYDYVCDPNRTMVENVVTALQVLFKIPATAENGFNPPPHLLHRRYKKRVAIHPTSYVKEKNWPHAKFLKFAQWLEAEGYEPAFLPLFPSLDELASFIYESGFFIGVDSGPGHIASCLKIPHLIIGREAKQMRLWRPGWTLGEVVVPPTWIPNWKGLRLREERWQMFVTVKNVINRFKTRVLSN